jgi:hypothetical protein
MNRQEFLTFCFSFVLLCGVAPRARSEISRPEIKCMSAPQYYPGCCNGFNNALADQLEYLRTNMIRIEFIAESDGSIDYCPWDYTVDVAADHNIKVLGLLDYATFPAANADVWATEAYRTAFAERVTDIVTHYATRENPIRHWEIWNEQDLDLSGIDGPDYRIEPEPYAELLIEAYKAIKSVDSGTSVILGGISPKGFYYSENYLEDFYNTTAMQNYYTANDSYPFDVVACHPYPEYDPDPADFLAQELNTKIKAVMNDHGDREKKVWLTELGWSTYWLSGTQEQREAKQASALAEAFELLDTLTDPAPASAGLPPYVDRIFWFRWNNFSEADQWGLIRDDGTYRPSYYAYLNLTDPGPPPPTPNPDPGEFPPVSGTSDADLPYEDENEQPLRVSDSDLLHGVVGERLAGGFHDLTQPTGEQDRISVLTDGNFNSNGLSVILNDYALPSLYVRYTFPQPMNIYDIRIFAGHFGDTGNRAFINCDILINDELAREELKSGILGQNPVGGDSVAVVRWAPDEGQSFVAENVSNIEFKFYCVSGIGAGFLDPWDPCQHPDKDKDGTGMAYVASIIKEIDVFGEPVPVATPTSTPTSTPTPAPTATPTPTPVPTPTPLPLGWFLR